MTFPYVNPSEWTAQDVAENTIKHTAGAVRAEILAAIVEIDAGTMNVRHLLKLWRDGGPLQNRMASLEALRPEIIVAGLEADLDALLVAVEAFRAEIDDTTLLWASGPLKKLKVGMFQQAPGGARKAPPAKFTALELAPVKTLLNAVLATLG